MGKNDSIDYDNLTYGDIFFLSSFPISAVAPLSSLSTAICSSPLPSNLTDLANLACLVAVLVCPAAILAAHPFHRPILPLIFGEKFESF